MKRLQKYIAVLIILALLLPIASAITYPILKGYVTDNANIITPEYIEKITNLADRINKNTTVEIAVLTVGSLEGDTPENYALQTFRQNGVGKKDNNNGLLILVSKNDRKYKFEVGYGLEGTITDAMKVPIGDKIITPNFKQGEYGKGIYESMLVIEGLVTNNTEVLSKYGMAPNSGSGDNGNGESGSGGSGGDGVFLLFIMVFGAIVIYAIIVRPTNDVRVESPPSLPTTYRPPPYTRSGRSGSTRSTSSNSSSRRSSSYNSYSSGSSNISHGSHSFGGGFGGFGGGRSGGGGFGGGW